MTEIIPLHPTDKWEEMQYPFTRHTKPGILQDIQDGTLYRELMQPGQFLSVPEHTGLILCSDGVRLFRSCGQSMWPSEMVVTSLPPKVRMNADNLLLGGVWLGPVKPDMKVILKPILDKIEELNLHGVTVKTQNGTKQVRARLLLGVFDLPAKAMATDINTMAGSVARTALTKVSISLTVPFFYLNVPISLKQHSQLNIVQHRH